jgi:hypothetical protein
VEADEVITDFANVYFVVFDEGEDLAVAWRICEFDGVLRLVKGGFGSGLLLRCLLVLVVPPLAVLLLFLDDLLLEGSQGLQLLLLPAGQLLLLAFPLFTVLFFRSFLLTLPVGLLVLLLLDIADGF